MPDNHNEIEKTFIINWPEHDLIDFESKHFFYDRSELRIDLGTKTPLYRYTKKKYFDEFMQTGRLRLNTLFYYFNLESLGNQIGDDEEGQIFFNSRLNKDHIDGMPTIFYGNSVNRYLLCLSSERAPCFEEMEDKDCCFEINSVNFFIDIARSCLNSWRHGWLGPVDYIETKQFVRECIAGRQIPPFALVKDPEFSDQKEVRFWLEPYTHPKKPIPSDNEILTNAYDGDIQSALNHPSLLPGLKPIDIHIPNSRKYCKLV